MADYLALQELTAAQLDGDFDDLESLTTVDDRQNTAGTTTSVSYTATLTGGTACGIAFTAPPSGKVKIENNCWMFNSGNFHCLTTIHVRNGSTIGSGTDVLASSDDEALIMLGTDDERQGCSRLLSGLTPGNNYNVQQEFKVAGGTGTFRSKSLIVTKVL